jgi:hypothetical protein
MARLAFGLLAFAFAVGCTKAPPPIQIAKPIETDPTPTAPKLDKSPAPAKSDPASVAIVEAAIKAHTGGKPELLSGWKATSFKLVGRINPRAPIPATLEVKMEWPEKFRARWDLAGQIPYVVVRHGETVWNETEGRDKLLASPEKAADIIADTPTQWLCFLGCLTNPDAVFAPFPPLESLDRPNVGVRVWCPNLPPAVVHFETETKRVAQITAIGREDGKEVTKEFYFEKGATFKAANGVQFPDKRVDKINGAAMGEWEIASVELGAPIDAKLFEKPK